LPVQPDPNGVPHQVPVWDEARDGETAVFAVIAIVAHEKILTLGITAPLTVSRLSLTTT
jgi:hypothetical protein